MYVCVFFYVLRGSIHWIVFVLDIKSSNYILIKKRYIYITIFLNDDSIIVS